MGGHAGQPGVRDRLFDGARPRAAGRRGGCAVGRKPGPRPRRPRRMGNGRLRRHGGGALRAARGGSRHRVVGGARRAGRAPLARSPVAHGLDRRAAAEPRAGPRHHRAGPGPGAGPVATPPGRRLLRPAGHVGTHQRRRPARQGDGPGVPVPGVAEMAGIECHRRLQSLCRGSNRLRHASPAFPPVANPPVARRHHRLDQRRLRGAGRTGRDRHRFHPPDRRRRHHLRHHAGAGAVQLRRGVRSGTHGADRKPAAGRGGTAGAGRVAPSRRQRGAPARPGSAQRVPRSRLFVPGAAHAGGRNRAQAGRGDRPARTRHPAAGRPRPGAIHAAVGPRLQHAHRNAGHGRRHAGRLARRRTPAGAHDVPLYRDARPGHHRDPRDIRPGCPRAPDVVPAALRCLCLRTAGLDARAPAAAVAPGRHRPDRLRPVARHPRHPDRLRLYAHRAHRPRADQQDRQRRALRPHAAAVRAPGQPSSCA